MTTLKRELRMKIRETLSTYAIDDLEIEMALVEVVYPYVSKPPERKGIINAIVDGQSMQIGMIERVRKALRLNVEKPTKSHLEFIDFLKSKEREGMNIEGFAGYWTKEHWSGKQGQVPTINQVIENWYAAFMGTPTHSNGDREYVEIY